MSLVEQRNRFLSFAFASADILIETDLDGHTCYAAGASAVFGNPPLEDSQDRLSDRLDRTSRPIMKALMRGLRVGRRAGPARITVGGREARLCGWLLGKDDRIRWTLSFEGVNAPKEVEPAEFEKLAEDAIQNARQSDIAMDMSALRIAGLNDLERNIGQEAAERLRRAIYSATMLCVGETGVSRPVGESRWALIHPRSAELKNLEAEIKSILEENRLDEAEVFIESLSDVPDLDPKVSVQAFIHAVNQAAESDSALDMVSLKDIADEMVQETERRMSELKTTIAGRVFEPYAQPIVNLKTGQVHHYELLLRLPGGGPISESVGFAESTGLIFEIDYAMTEIAANFLRDDFDRPALAVNLSGKSLANHAWGKKFLKLLSDLKIDRSRLSFELTETATVTNVKAANTIIQKIRERGHKVCLDDFGEGAAGFQYLRDFPADVIKIDGSYVSRATKSDRDATILKGMVAISSDLGAEIVAEMIETKGQATSMKAMGITYGQGYYFGKPLPLKKLSDSRSRTPNAA